MKKALLIGLTAAICSPAALASDVDSGNVTTFTSGSAAQASEVNANFAALITAINDNNDRIADLEAANGDVTALSDVVSGSTYQLFFSGGIIELDEGGGGNLEHFGGNTVLVFNSDGSLGETFNESGRFISLDQQFCDQEGLNCEHFVDTWDDVNEVGTGSWAVSGQDLNVTWADGDSETFKLSANGEILMAGGGSLDEDDGTSGLETFVAVGLRLAPQP